MSKFALKKKEYDMSEETALEQVMEVLEFYNININHIIDPAHQTSSEQALTKLQEAYQDGKLQNKTDEKGMFTIVQNVKGSDGAEAVMNYAQLTANHKLQMDGKKEGQNYARMYALLGSLTNVGDKGIKKLHAVDLGIAECLGFVFLAV